jgi:adenylate cyclase
VSAFRATAAADSPIVTRIVTAKDGSFVAHVHTRAANARLRDGVVTTEAAPDPRQDTTYTSSVHEATVGRTASIQSDLYPSELDARLPDRQKRIVVTVQRAVTDSQGAISGVVRVGILARTVDEIARVRVDEGDANDPHRVFLCDRHGHLLTRLAPNDPVGVLDDERRVMPQQMPPEVARALASPKLGEISADHPMASESFSVGGRRFLLTLRWLSQTQDWIAVILVPEDHYTRDLRALRDRFVIIDAIGALAVLIGGALLLGAVRGGFHRLLATTSRMRDFDFSADPRPSALRDVDEVVEGLERAKTAMRTLGKYVPVDLVRELYATNREPTLGGELKTLTLMFTDIRGFTDLSEQISPNELAHALGLYLEAMTTAIRATGGTIDKFIGDAVMSIWNAPSPVPQHARHACRAALACAEATASLYASDAWRGLPPLLTRFGLHTDDVLVGHFGAPARFSYTALGDGVNLASRLESLCKQYGVVRLVSDAVEKDAREEFTFRKLDRVAVKGKSRAVLVFELLGDRTTPRSPAVVAYEAALDDYWARRFDAAIARLAPFVASDPPSEVLVARCRAYVASPPPADWDGSWVAHSK